MKETGETFPAWLLSKYCFCYVSIFGGFMLDLTYRGINFTPVGCFIHRKYVYQQYGKEKASGEGFAL